MALVTVGMPVYNGAPYVEEALCSVLSQTERDLAVIVSDDGSTDGTDRICERIAASDDRVTFLRSPGHLGMNGNFLYTLEQANKRTDSPFFMWVAQDDPRAPGFLDETIGLLNTHPEAVGAVTAIDCIEAATSEYLFAFSYPAEMSDANPITRARSTMNGAYQGIFGLFRREALTTHTVLRDVYGPDMAFIFGMLLHAPIAISSRTLMTRRSTGYDEVQGPDGRTVWEKSLGPEGHLYVVRATPLSRVMLGQVWRSTLSFRRKIVLTGFVAHGVWWWLARWSALRDGRRRIRYALDHHRYFAAVALGLRHALFSPRSILSVLRRLSPVPVLRRAT